MKHDLNAINAAIALGDRVIPPNGCVVRYYDITHNREYIGDIIITKKYGTTSSYYNSSTIRLSNNILPDGIVHMHNGYVDMHLDKTFGFDDKLLEVLFIPKGTPPFEEWERY